MTALDDLLERLENATGPTSALFWDAFAVVWPDGAPHEIWLRFAKLLDNEAWLDAAMSLVLWDDVSYFTLHYVVHDGTWRCDLHYAEPGCLAQIDAKTQALAVATAALKSRKDTP